MKMTKAAFFDLLANCNLRGRAVICVGQSDDARVYGTVELHVGCTFVATLGTYRHADTFEAGLSKAMRFIDAWEAVNYQPQDADVIGVTTDLIRLDCDSSIITECIAAVNDSPRMARMVRATIRSAVEMWDCGNEHKHFKTLDATVRAYVQANVDDHAPRCLLGKIEFTFTNPKLIRLGDTVEIGSFDPLVAVAVFNGVVTFADGSVTTGGARVTNSPAFLRNEYHSPDDCLDTLNDLMNRDIPYNAMHTNASTLGYAVFTDAEGYTVGQLASAEPELTTAWCNSAINIRQYDRALTVAEALGFISERAELKEMAGDGMRLVPWAVMVLDENGDYESYAHANTFREARAEMYDIKARRDVSVYLVNTTK